MKWYSLGYIAGLSSLNFIQSAELVVWQISFCVLVIVTIWMALNRSLIGHQYLHFAKFTISIVVGLLFAALSAQVWLSQSKNLISHPQVYQVEGLICSIPERSSDHSSSKESKQFTVKFDFCVSKLDTNAMGILQNDKLKLSYYRIDEKLSKSLTAGTHWRLTVKLKPNHGRLNPAGFDYEKWLLSEGYLATGYIKNAEVLGRELSLQGGYHRTRQSIYDAVVQATKNENTRGVILALSMGERAEINPSQWQHIVDSGTAHLLAISGLHIGIAALWGYYFFLYIFKNLPWITRRYPAQRIAELFSLASALGVTLISGLGFPSQRAMIMLSIYLGCRWSGRKLSLSDLLGLSVIVITLFQPFAVMSMSFWLSVYAVVVIALVTSYKQQTNQKLTKIKAWLRFNWLLFLGLIPILWWFFNQFSLVGFIANVILIPLTTFLTAPLIYVGLITLLFSEQAASWVFRLVDYAISLTLWTQQKLAGLNELVLIPSLSSIGALALWLAMLLLLLPKSVPGRSLFFPVAILLVATLYASNRPSNFKLTLFDVGHGLAISVSKGKNQLIYDTGFGRFATKKVLNSQNTTNIVSQERSVSEYSVARSSLIPFLKKQGIRHIDTLVISHSDADHSGGLVDVLNHFSIGELLLGEPELIQSKKLKLNMSEASITHISPCHHKKSFSWNKVSFKFITTKNHFKAIENTNDKTEVATLSPILNYSGNNASCILLIETEHNRLVIAGDIEKRVESDLVNEDKKRLLAGVDLLVAPHHGSETSSTEDFVNHLSPKLVLFSAGYANQWRFPRDAVVNRYQNVDATMLTSFEKGAITITESPEGQLLVETERQRKPRFWHRNQP